MAARHGLTISTRFGFLVALVACAAAPQYGTFLRGHEQAQQVIAEDAALKLASEYSPDSHSIRLEYAAGDSFGARFATELRKQGYALQQPNATDAARRELQVRYVLDVIKGTGLLRLSIHLPQRRLSRAYGERAGQVYPSGPWSSEVHDE